MTNREIRTTARMILPWALAQVEAGKEEEAFDIALGIAEDFEAFVSAHCKPEFGDQAPRPKCPPELAARRMNVQAELTDLNSKIKTAKAHKQGHKYVAQLQRRRAEVTNELAGIESEISEAKS